MARSKTASRRAAAKKKTPKKGKSKAAAKKVAKTSKRRATAKKAPARRKRPTLAGKISVPRSAPPPAVTELDRRIAIVRNNLRELTELAAASSGASTEELTSGRIAEQEAELQILTKQRADLVRGS